MNPRNPTPSDSVVVGRIGRPHGLRGDLFVEPLTDEPERRFADGAKLSASTPDGRPGVPVLTVAASRLQQGRLVVRFAEIGDRTAAEGARGTLLEVPLDPAESPADPEEFYDHQLVGLAVEDPAGTPLGAVVDVEHTGAQDLLHLALPDGRTVLFPFVAALVPTVDIRAGRVVVDDRPGLLAPERSEEPEGPSS
ncbi:MAG: ribosome maturation factor RimM [Marmoricola sp.]